MVTQESHCPSGHLQGQAAAQVTARKKGRSQEICWPGRDFFLRRNIEKKLKEITLVLLINKIQFCFVVNNIRKITSKERKGRER